MIENIKKTIRNKILIYPYLSNNDKNSVDEYYESESILLNDLGDIFKENLRKKVKEFFRKYGYYTIRYLIKYCFIQLYYL